MDSTPQYVWQVKVTKRVSELWAKDYRETDLICDGSIVRYAIWA